MLTRSDRILRIVFVGANPCFIPFEWAVQEDNSPRAIVPAAAVPFFVWPHPMNTTRITTRPVIRFAHVSRAMVGGLAQVSGRPEHVGQISARGRRGRRMDSRRSVPSMLKPGYSKATPPPSAR
jgi:hypothetical protein